MAGPDLPFSSQSSSLSPMPEEVLELELELELELVRELEPVPVPVPLPPEGGGDDAVNHAGGGGDDAVDDAVPDGQDVAHISQPEPGPDPSERHSKRPSSPFVPYLREEPAGVPLAQPVPLYASPTE